MTCTFESKRGYKSSYLFVCAKCGYTDTVKNTDSDTLKPDLNYAAVLAAMSIGISYSQLNEFSCKFKLIIKRSGDKPANLYKMKV